MEPDEEGTFLQPLVVLLARLRVNVQPLHESVDAVRRLSKQTCPISFPWPTTSLELVQNPSVGRKQNMKVDLDRLCTDGRWPLTAFVAMRDMFDINEGK